MVAAFGILDNQSIEKSLVSENPLVRIFALLDRRLGKRRLLEGELASDLLASPVANTTEEGCSAWKQVFTIRFIRGMTSSMQVLVANFHVIRYDEKESIKHTSIT